MPRKRVLRIGLYGSLGLILLLILLNPYARQSLFGPKIQNIPLCYWQENFRHYADSGGNRDSVTRKMLGWLGFNQRDEPGGLPDKRADMLPILLSLVADPQSRVREMVAFSLGRGFNPDDCVPPLMRLLDDSDPRVRAAAAGSLGDMRPEVTAALPRLLELLADADTSCRVQAAWAVWRVGQRQHREVVPILRQALKDPDQRCRCDAAMVLDGMGKDGADAFPEVAACATADPNRNVRIMTVNTLGVYGQPAIPILVKLLCDPDANIRRAATRALGRIGPDAKETLPEIQAMLRDPHVDAEIVREALQRIDPEPIPAPKREPE